MDVSDGNFYIKNRVRQQKNMSKDLDKITEGFDIFSAKGGGPTMEKNMNDFAELKELQNTYSKDLHMYNQAIKHLIENSRGYVNASNMNNNKFHNKYIRDPISGAIGYVNNRGVYKYIPSPSIANSFSGKGGCPGNWSGSYTNQSADKGQVYTIFTAPEGEIVKTGGIPLIKGSNMVTSQLCSAPGSNLFITEPASITSGPTYSGCFSGNTGTYQEDLGDTTFSQCQQRAADKGSDVFIFGQANGSTAPCYVGGDTNSPVNGKYCSGSDPVFGGEIPGYEKKLNWLQKIKRDEDIFLGEADPYWVPAVSTYSKYTTTGANNSSLNKAYHITDDLIAKKYPDSMAQNGVLNAPGEFQLIDGYYATGTAISSGTSTNIDEIKKLCIATQGCNGFSYNTSTGEYWFNSNMWPAGNRIQDTSYQMYIRMPQITNNNSCNSTDVIPVSQNELYGTSSGGYPLGEEMSPSTTCALGTIAARDFQAINVQYDKLSSILNELKNKIQQLTRDDLVLNERLLSEHKLLENKLQKYEQTYKEIKREKYLIKADDAFQQDSELNMLSYNKQYIIWSILALGMTYGAMKYMK